MPASVEQLLSISDLPGARQLGTLYRGAAVVVIRERVLEAILEFSERDVTRECGGFLLGQVYDQEPSYVVVRHFHPAIEAQGSMASLTFTHDSWAVLTREIEANFPEEILLGWQHTHPGMGVFLSSYDLFIQKNFFAQRWQIAMVVDPKRQDFGFFHWRGDEVQDCGFVCVQE